MNIVRYRDFEGDKVTIASDKELLHAFAAHLSRIRYKRKSASKRRRRKRHGTKQIRQQKLKRNAELNVDIANSDAVEGDLQEVELLSLSSPATTPTSYHRISFRVHVSPSVVKHNEYDKTSLQHSQSATTSPAKAKSGGENFLLLHKNGKGYTHNGQVDARQTKLRRHLSKNNAENCVCCSNPYSLFNYVSACC